MRRVASNTAGMLAACCVSIAGCGRLDYAAANGLDGGSDDRTPDADVFNACGVSSSGQLFYLPLDEVDPADVGDALNQYAVSCLGSCPTATAGVVGGGMLFERTGRLSVDIVDLVPTEFTVAAWVRVDQVADLATTDVFISKHVGVDQESIELSIRDNFDIVADLDLATASGTSGPRAPAAFELGEPAHIAATWDGDTTRLYQRGYLAALVSGMSADFDASPFILGGRGESASFAGMLDEVRVYTRALNATEIEALARCR